MDATFTTPYLLVSDPQALTVLHADRDDDDRRALDRAEGSEAVLSAEADLPMRAEGCRPGEQPAVTRLDRLELVVPVLAHRAGLTVRVPNTDMPRSTPRHQDEDRGAAGRGRGSSAAFDRGGRSRPPRPPRSGRSARP